MASASHIEEDTSALFPMHLEKPASGIKSCQLALIGLR